MQQSENRFFRFVWRFNALAIAAAATAVTVFAVFLLLTFLGEEMRASENAKVVNIAQPGPASDDLSLDRTDTIAGTSLVRVSLSRGQPHGPSSLPSLKSGRRNVVNYLFLNMSTYQSRWMFNGVGQIVVQGYTLFDKAKGPRDQERAVVGFMFAMVDADSNGDGQLTEKDAISLATIAVDGTGYRKLVEGIDQLFSIEQVADDKVLVLYEKKGETRTDLYSVPSIVPLMQASVPKIN